MSRLISFRGKLADSGQETIHLQTIDGTIGYRINKLEIMGAEPGTGTYELVLQIWSIEQSTVVATVDFSDPTLLGVAYHRDNAGSQYPESSTIIFNTTIFNQNTFITAKDASGNTKPINYHIELEQFKLDGNENAVATLKNIKNRG